jgi:multiple sugar transport system ATP-binding protein
MAEVALERLTKIYPPHIPALVDLDLHVADGELLVLLGPSGCGKSTVLRLIAGLETPTSGRIRLGGRDVEHEPPHRRGISLAFQGPALYPHLSVHENLAFSARLAGQRPALAVAEVAEALDLAALLERRPDELSGGEQQRVALGRALVRAAGVVLLDEPFGHQDAHLRRRLRSQLPLLRRRLRATMILVTHDQEEALLLGDRIAVLCGGALQQTATPAELYQRPANRFVAGFVGSPPMSFLEGSLAAAGDALVLARGDNRLTFPGKLHPPWIGLLGKAVVLGFRPEDARAVAPGPPGGSRDDVSPLVLEVISVERVGRTAWVKLARGAWNVTAVLPDDVPAAVGSPLPVRFVLERAVVFDPGTGQRLGP